MIKKSKEKSLKSIVEYIGSALVVDPDVALKHGEDALNNSLKKWIDSERSKLEKNKILDREVQLLKSKDQ